MTIAELSTMAKYGELRNLGLGDESEELILSYVNLGMIELYKRFRLSTKEHLIALIDAQIEYTLPDDCMWLISAYGEIPENTNFSTYELSINNEDVVKLKSLTLVIIFEPILKLPVIEFRKLLKDGTNKDPFLSDDILF